jgi:hypothetical protein
MSHSAARIRRSGFWVLGDWRMWVPGPTGSYEKALKEVSNEKGFLPQ